MSRAKLMTDAIDAFVVGCKADGIWDAIKACCILAGWDGLAGALTPIKGSAPTNVNFVAGDYNRKMGLVGNGSTKYLNSNRANNADGRDDNHNAVFATRIGSANGCFIASLDVLDAGINALLGGSSNTLFSRSRSTTGTAQADNPSAGLIALSRSSSSEYSVRNAATTRTVGVASDGVTAVNVTLFARGSASPNYSDARLAFYSIGSALDLALLDSRVSTLLTSIWRAVHPEFTVVTNPDAMDWIGRVYDAGGSVSVSTANAVNTFCNAIDSAGIRSKFLRLGIFAGNDLTSALVPLYRSSAYGGAVVGGATDTNNNFVSADYVETGASGGITGNATTKYLNTGFATQNLPGVNDCHIAVWSPAASVTTTRRLIGAFGASNDAYVIDRRLTAAGGNLSRLGGTANFGTSVFDSDTQSMIASRTSATSATLYKNASSVATQTTTLSGVTLTSQVFGVFADLSNGTTAGAFYPHRLCGYSIGGGLTGEQVTSFHNAWLALQTALGRQA